MSGLMQAFLDEFEPALDPVAFAKQCGLGEPDEWQRRFLRSESRRVIVVAARQLGKSHCCAILSLHRALHYPKSTIVIVSPSLRQSQLLFRQVLNSYRHLGKPVASDIENRLSLELSNGSVIASLPGSEKTIRGFSRVNLIVLDEAAAVDDTLLAALTPMLLVSGGRLIMVSTPRGRAGHFYERWISAAERGWETFCIPVTSVPRITPEAIEDQRKDMTEREFRQELLCEWVEDSDSAFAYSDIERAFTLDEEWEPFLTPQRKEAVGW